MAMPTRVLQSWDEVVALLTTLEGEVDPSGDGQLGPHQRLYWSPVYEGWLIVTRRSADYLVEWHADCPCMH